MTRELGAGRAAAFIYEPKERRQGLRKKKGIYANCGDYRDPASGFLSIINRAISSPAEAQKYHTYEGKHRTKRDVASNADPTSPHLDAECDYHPRTTEEKATPPIGSLL